MAQAYSIYARKIRDLQQNVPIGVGDTKAACTTWDFKGGCFGQGWGQGELDPTWQKSDLACRVNWK